MDEGWIRYLDHAGRCTAPSGVPLIFHRAGSADVVMTREEMHPAMNVNGLFWKKTGLAKALEPDEQFVR